MTKHRFKHFFKIISLLYITLLISCTNNVDQQQATNIASVLPITGPASFLGVDMKKGQDLAMEYWNSLPSTKQKVKIFYDDSKSRPIDGTNAVQRFLSQGHKIFIISLSNVGMAVKSILKTAKALTFIDASNPGITKPPNKLLFRHSQTAFAEADIILKEASKISTVKNIVLFYLNDDYGKSFQKSFESQNSSSSNIKYIPYENTSPDLRTVAQTSGLDSKSLNTIVAVVGVGKPMGLLIKSLREQSYKGPVFCSLGYHVTGARSVLGKDRSNIYFTDLKWRQNKATLWIEKEFKKRFGKDAPAGAVIEFQSVLIIAKAAQDASSNSPVDVARFIPQASETFVGVKPVSPTNDIVPLVVLRSENALPDK